jgi:hypothetical protein
MRRHLAIFLAFQPDTGHAHPHRDAVIKNYATLLTAMGKTEADIIASLTALMQEMGLDRLCTGAAGAASPTACSAENAEIMRSQRRCSCAFGAARVVPPGATAPSRAAASRNTTPGTPPPRKESMRSQNLSVLCATKAQARATRQTPPSTPDQPIPLILNPVTREPGSHHQRKNHRHRRQPPPQAPPVLLRRPLVAQRTLRF